MTVIFTFLLIFVLSGCAEVKDNSENENKETQKEALGYAIS